VPFLRVGWNRQFLMMKEFGFVYDASMVAPFSDPPLWPYTLDHKIPHQCTGNNQRCPSRSYPGIWEMVMNQLAIEVHKFLSYRISRLVNHSVHSLYRYYHKRKKAFLILGKDLFCRIRLFLFWMNVCPIHQFNINNWHCPCTFLMSSGANHCAQQFCLLSLDH
jgi:hypothetical protein